MDVAHQAVMPEFFSLPREPLPPSNSVWEQKALAACRFASLWRRNPPEWLT